MRTSDFFMFAFGLSLCFVSFCDTIFAIDANIALVPADIAPCNNVKSPSPCKGDGLGSCGDTRWKACHKDNSTQTCSCQPTARRCQCSNIDP